MNKLPFTFSGQVVQGKQLGSKLGFPTANIAYDPCGCQWPYEGVYVGIAQIAGDPKRYVTILNQGKHPTAPDGMPSVEAHLLNYPNHALYGQQLMLTYHHFLRQEQTFESLEKLKAQLAIDREHAIQWAQVFAPTVFS